MSFLSKDTRTRIISALILMLITALGFYYGTIAMMGLFFIFAHILYEEIYSNVLGNKDRKTLIYGLGHLLIFAVLGLKFLGIIPLPISLTFLFIGIGFNILIIYYLFRMDGLISKLRGRNSFIASIAIILWIIPLLEIFNEPTWRYILVNLFILNFSMDIAAWFFGKNFGKRKLWPSVSPNKTVEGLIGGVVSSAIISGTFWNFYIKDNGYAIYPIFLVLALLSHAGDLFQSKIKREAGIKDSSALIPGHGGVYDRVDGLLLVGPFYTLIIYYL